MGVLGIWLARPTWPSLAVGSAVAVAGEAIRIWAAGHLERGRGVTTSGPYRWTRHPLYLGSSIIGVGFAVTSARWLVALMSGVYLVVTLTAAVRTEEAALRAAFRDEYEAYYRGRALGPDRPFSMARALANREQRAVLGLLTVMLLLAVKVWAA